MRLPHLLFLPALSLLVSAGPVLAQVSSTVFRSGAVLPRSPHANIFSVKGWTLTMGLVGVAAPAWWGSRDKSYSIYPDIRLNYRDDVFFSVPDGLGWNAVNRNGWKIGPVVKPRTGRGEGRGSFPFQLAGGSSALVGMGDIKAAFEFGGFAQDSLADDKLILRAELRRGIGGNNGVVADTIATWADGTANDSLFWYVSARAGWSDSAFSNVYFGVSPEQAARTGLAEAHTGSGLISLSTTGTLVVPLGNKGDKGGLLLFGSYERLGDPVARSSLIRDRGDRNQLVVGFGYGLRFGPK